MRQVLIFFFALLAFDATALTVSSKTYSHPLGVVFQYPGDWAVRESPFTDLELVPPNAASNERGPTETYFLMVYGVSANSATDPRLVEQIENLIKQIAPFLVPMGDSEAFTTPPKSALLRWHGTSPVGLEAEALAYVLPTPQISFSLIALGAKQQIEAREQTLRGIFSSFKVQTGSKDPNLVGYWDDKVDKTYMELRANGKFTAIQESEGSETSTQTKSDEQSETTTGYWFAGGGRLYLITNNSNSLSVRYSLQGKPGSRTLTIRQGSGQQQILQESNPDLKRKDRKVR